jgi:predicted amidohydrolase
MAKLFVAVWTVGTQSYSWTVRDLHARCLELENALAAAEALRIQQPNDPRGLFVAPEYMFSLEEARRPADQRFQMDAADARILKTRLAELSNRFPKLLLVPGSIAFEKEIASLDDEAKKRTGKWFQNLQKHGEVLRSGVVRPPSVEDEAEAHERKMAEFRAKVGKVRRGKAPSLRIARNTAYGYWAGVKVFACRKRGEVGEIFGENDAFYINAGESTVWTHDGVKFGVEICKDASDGYLRNVANEVVDVQIVISASLGLSDIQACGEKCIVHAAQQQEEAGVFTATKGRIPPLKNTRTQIGGFNLDFFVVEVGGG